MENRFKIIIYNKTLFQEIELGPENHKVMIGTAPSNDVRLRKDLFFGEFYLELFQKNDVWDLRCSPGVYIDCGDLRKLIFFSLVHGDEISIRYKSTDSELLKLKFLIDFDYKSKNYDCEIPVPVGSKITIGSSKCNTIYINSKYAKNDLLELTANKNSLHLEVKNTTYGVNINGNRIEKNSTEIKEYDFFSVAEFYFYYKNGNLYSDSTNTMDIHQLSYSNRSDNEKREYPRFNLNTRIKTVVPDKPISVLDPPERPEKPKNNLLMSVIPAFVMLMLTIVIRGFMSSTGSTFVIFSACSIGLGIVTSIVSYLQGKKEYNEAIIKRNAEYKNYIDLKRKEIQESRDSERVLLEHIYPDIHEEIDRVNEFSGSLFDRTPSDTDFLDVRVGTGSVEAARKIQYKMQERFITDDELVYFPERVATDFKYIDNCPITVGFRTSNAVGIIGDYSALLGFSRNITIDLAVRQYFGNVKLVYILNPDIKADFEWIRFLPHVKHNGMTVRSIAFDEYGRTALYEELYKEFLTRSEQAEKKFVHMIIQVFDCEELLCHPLSRFIATASAINVSFVFYEKSKRKLPLGCSYIITVSHHQGKIVSTSDERNYSEFKYDAVSEIIAEKVAMRLAPIYSEEISLEGGLVKSISLFDLLSIYSVEDLDLSKRWAESQICKSMAAPLGVKTKNEIIYLDIHEKGHGPHGLVAGTTGSGKSEILQSYILSLATLFHPYEVGFVIIDFKGGGMANQFINLPHLVGTITNIDGRQINRSLLSIKAELLKRQTLFAKADVNHIDKYIDLFKKKKVDIPLPHLIIVVDEFAELKAEHPDFMKELISASRIGRSLGVHLILATQKPSGQVSEQIWSNSKFKLCLKVQSTEDSREMIRSPLAAEIVEPGRAYFQVGNNEVFELFQSGYSGAPEKIESSSYNTKPFKVNKISFDGRRECVFEQKSVEKEASRTQLQAIVGYVQSYCNEAKITRLPSICLPPLSDNISYPTLTKDYGRYENIIPIGVLDDPQHQAQTTTTINLTVDNTIIIGSSQFGKTNLIQTIIRGISTNYSPREVNIYIADFGSMILKNFEEMAHVGGVVTSNEDEKFKNLIKMLNDEISVRKEKFANLGVTSISSYREAGMTDIPQIVFIIDNFTAVRELYLLEEDVILPICRDGLSYGVSVILANQVTTGLGYRYFSNFSKRIVYTCNENSEYSTVISRCRLYPEAIPGRAVTEIDKEIFEFQTYLCFEGEREVERIQQIKAFVERTNDLYPDLRARKIPEIPGVLDEDTFENEFHINRRNTYTVPIGLLYRNVSVMSIDLLSQGLFTIAGNFQDKERNLFNVIVSQLYRNMFECPVELSMIDDLQRNLKEFKDWGIVTEYSIDANDIINTVDHVYDIANQRFEDLAEGNLLSLKDEALQLIVINNAEALTVLSKNLNSMKKFKELIGRLKTMKVCVLILGIENATIPYNASEIMKYIKENKNFFIFEDLINVKLCDVTSLILKKFKKKLEMGDCYWVTQDGFEKMKTVIHENGGGSKWQ